MKFRTIMAVCLLAAALIAGSAGEKAYDPLALAAAEGEGVDAIFRDAERDREIPLKIYLPEKEEAAPVILFSHGLGGSRENSVYLGKHWSSRGYAMVAMQHAGSDEAVWREAAALDRRKALSEAANGENFMARAADVRAVLDQLEKWNAQDGHDFEGRFNLSHIGMSGHSFGAVTTQAVSGQAFGPRGASLTDARIDAALALSPSPPTAGSAADAFAAVKIPWMLMTGTKDSSSIGRTTPGKRLEVYPYLPAGGKYELVLLDGEHMAFSDRTLRGGEQRNPNHHRVIKALSTAFWDAHLRGDAGARAWLEGEGARALLEEGDRWQWK